jgi:hypothetical protein
MEGNDLYNENYSMSLKNKIYKDIRRQKESHAHGLAESIL